MSDIRNFREPLSAEDRTYHEYWVKHYDADDGGRNLHQIILDLDDSLKAWILDSEKQYQETVPAWMHDRGMKQFRELEDKLREKTQYGEDWRQRADECLMMAAEKDKQLLKLFHEHEGLATQYEEETFALKQKIDELEKSNECFRVKLGTAYNDVDDTAASKIEELKREISVLRYYGNKDCTAQAEEALARGDSFV